MIMDGFFIVLFIGSMLHRMIEAAHGCGRKEWVGFGPEKMSGLICGLTIPVTGFICLPANLEPILFIMIIQAPFIETFDF